MFSCHAIKWKLYFSNLNVSLFQLITKNEKEKMLYITCLLVASQESNKLKF
jgi:hypothetical protein